MLKVKFRVHGRGTSPYVSDLGYVSKTQTRCTPSYDSQCKTEVVLNIQPKEISWNQGANDFFLRIFFRRLRQILQVEPMCNSSTKSSSKQFKVFSWKQHNYNVIIFKFQGSATFPPLPLPPRAPTCTRWHIVCLGYVTTYSRVARIRIHFLETFQLY